MWGRLLRISPYAGCSWPMAIGGGIEPSGRRKVVANRSICAVLRVETKQIFRPLVHQPDFFQKTVVFFPKRQRRLTGVPLEADCQRPPLGVANRAKFIGQLPRKESGCGSCRTVNPDRRILLRHKMQLRIAKNCSDQNRQGYNDNEPPRDPSCHTILNGSYACHRHSFS